ncbi:MAG: PaaI family thioesterase [Acidobacteria bacterium]|nr:MAG: PaaI family thioesterase [Acidobacteriota bacterium]
MTSAADLHARLDAIPIFKLLKLRLLETGDGTARLLAPYERAYDGIFESFHGGLLMTLADTVACIAILTRTGADERLTTTDMNIRFLAACNSDATAEARVIKLGRTLCPVEVNLYDAGRKHIAVAQVTYMRLGR